MSELLEITKQDIARLEDDELRNLIGLLCEADFRKYGLATKGIQWGGHQDAPDGGIDVLVKSNIEPPAESYVPSSHTIFQSKKTDMKPALIRKEMQSSGLLKELIANLANDGGAYIIASSQNISSKIHKAREDEMKKIVGDYNIKVDYFDGGRIATWVRNHPSLILWVRNRAKRPIYGWKSYPDWVSNLAKDEDYILDAECRLIDKRKKGTESSIENGITEIRNLLSISGSYLRLTGLSGVGKTRFAQALFDDKIGAGALNQSYVIYTDVSDDPTPSPQNIAEQIIALGCRTILIVDNCSPELHRSLVNICHHRSHLISLLTIEYDVADDQPEETKVFHLEPASERVVEQLVLRKFPEISQIDARTIAEFSGGNPRVAFALANTIGQGESIGELTDNQLFKRLFHQRNVDTNDLQQSAEALSLIYSFNIADLNAEQSELRILGALSSSNPQILYKDTTELKRRDLVQARGNFRAVLPHAIANRLARVAIENMPMNLLNEHLLKKGNERLIISFAKRLSYLPDSEPVQAIVKSWFSEDGWMGEVSNLNDFGMSIFLNIAIVSPALALDSMKRAYEKIGANFTSRSNRHSRKMVDLLRKIAYDKRLFHRSANLIFYFALSESESEKKDGNSTTSLLRSLFQIYLSGTHVEIDERLEFIRSLWLSNILTHQEIAIELLASCLKTSRFENHYNSSFGGRSRDFGYQPKSGSDIEKWYEQSALLCLDFATSTSSVADKAKKILANSIRGLWDHAEMFAVVEKICDELGGREYWQDGWLAIRRTLLLGKKANKLKEPERLAKLCANLQPRSLVDKVRTFALGGREPFDTITAFSKNHKLAEQKIAQYIGRLGAQLVKEPEHLNEILNELLLPGNLFAWQLGTGLWKGSPDKKAIWNQIEDRIGTTQQSEVSLSALFAMLSEMFEKDPDLAEAKMDEILVNENLRGYFVDFQCATPITDRAIIRIKNAVKENHNPVWSYRRLGWGRIHETISDDDFSEIVKEIGKKVGGLVVALDLLSMRFFGSPVDRKYSPKLIEIGRELLAKVDFALEEFQSDQVDHDLEQVIKCCLQGFGGQDIAGIMLENLVGSLKYGSYYPTHLKGTLKSLVKVQPICVLNLLLLREDRESYGKMGIFELNLESNKSLVNHIDEAIILSWCEENPELRYPLVGRCMLTFEYDPDSGKIQWLTIFWNLVRQAPSLATFLSSIEITLQPRMVYESRVEILRSRLRLLESLFDSDLPELTLWANETHAKLEIAVKRELVIEEDRNRRVQETFE